MRSYNARLLMCFLALFAFIISAVSLNPAMADPALKVGIVDIERALAASKAGKEAQKKYEAEVKKLQAKIDDKKGEFEKLSKDYSKQKDSLNDKARADKEEELVGMEKELKRNFLDSQESLKRRNGQLVTELVEKLKKVVDDYGKSQGFTMILERRGQSVLFADDNIDVTDAIVKRFDEAS